ncbi:acetolactate synthase [Aeromicrobium sp. A1-2]|uniref:thiamine pyrophosphate-binding protein n=1 Tax=Aeromicrobium sp. A1-2 TaxID=2107713 RepID=UPI000E492E6E|nr:thiamine pyrophosphate-dependent enzyme [Aeromicrobium sp. A1-2]AXT84156.1 acetolactate synthase [Aeromicrobium sp. A1-2]
MAIMTGGEAVARSLAAHGADVVFGIPGNHNLPIYEHLASNDIRHFLSRHEQGCGFGADGYARVTGRPGIALVTAGPAVLNTLAALSQSYADSVPVLMVSPGMPLRHPFGGNGHLHEVKDQQAAVDAVVSVSHRVSSVDEIGDAITQAYSDMTAGRPRPVHVEIPIDVLDEVADTEVGMPLALPTVSAPQGELTRAAAVLAESSRPGIVVGGGARAASAEVLALAEKLGASVVTTTNGKGILPEDHRLSLGAGAHLASVGEWVRSRDVLLAVGTDFGPSDLWNGPWTIDGTLVRIDIDPRQIGVNVRPDIALVSDAAAALGSLVDLIGDRHETSDGEALAWAARAHEESASEGALWADEMKAMSDVLDRNAIVAGDSAAVCYYGLRANLPLHTPGAFLYPTGSGTLGYGLPAAIGAKVAAPDRQVVAVMGDGGVMFTLPEIAAAAAEGMALPLIVIDNGGYGQIRKNMNLRGYDPLGVDFPSPDFAAAGRALGCYGMSIESPEQLSEELAKALVADRPTVLHVKEGRA